MAPVASAIGWRSDYLPDSTSISAGARVVKATQHILRPGNLADRFDRLGDSDRAHNRPRGKIHDLSCRPRAPRADERGSRPVEWRASSSPGAHVHPNRSTYVASRSALSGAIARRSSTVTQSIEPPRIARGKGTSVVGAVPPSGSRRGPAADDVHD